MPKTWIDERSVEQSKSAHDGTRAATKPKEGANDDSNNEVDIYATVGRKVH
jgi:hypothetical protein